MFTLRSAVSFTQRTFEWCEKDCVNGDSSRRSLGSQHSAAGRLSERETSVDWQKLIDSKWVAKKTQLQNCDCGEARTHVRSRESVLLNHRRSSENMLNVRRTNDFLLQTGQRRWLLCLATFVILLVAWSFLAAAEESTFEAKDRQLSLSERLELEATSVSPSPEVTVDFDRQVLPLLSDRCFACHGPDEAARCADLRLDQLAGAKSQLPSGVRAIVPGNPASSELIHRLRSTDEDLRMPPVDSDESLSDAEVEVLRRWIEQGAEYTEHWAFVAPSRVTPPTNHRSDWACNAIDLFVARMHAQQGLRPNPSASPEVLIRRVTLDLTGLPPDPTTVSTLLEDWSLETYASYVEQLLSSPDYGQRMATVWLDAARYADTNGYQHDNGRDMWPWRDWVVTALNDNMPFDQFTIEQLAGDLLPNPSFEQLVATGFNRNHGLNFEGGSIDEESRTDYVTDRTNTFGTLWMGVTLGCAQCHDHKYDPITQHDYYGLFAFFNNVDEVGYCGKEGNAEPKITVPWPEHTEELRRYQAEIEKLQQEINEALSSFDEGQAMWESEVLAGQEQLPRFPEDTEVEITFNERSLENTGQLPTLLSVIGQTQFVAGKTDQAIQLDGKTRIDCGDVASFDTEDSFSYGGWIYADRQQTKPIMGRAHFHGFGMVWEEGHIRADFVNRWDINAIFVKTEQPLPIQQWHHVMVTYDGTSKGSGVRIYVNGQSQPTEVFKDDLTGSIVSEVSFFLGSRDHQAPDRFYGKLDDVRVYGRQLSDVEVAQLAGQAPLDEFIQIPRQERTEAQRRGLREFYLHQHVPSFKQKLEKKSELERAYFVSKDHQLTTMVMRERAEPRITRRFKAGRYDQPLETVTAHFPSILSNSGSQIEPNRLTLARWLVSGRHPLTARVMVNRQWQLFFGQGIVSTPEDFGKQGARPTHPELLDWLANEFVSIGWDVKALHKLIVMSATYRQSSKTTAAGRRLDPENKWLSRYGRRRMTAEMLRDSALSASSLLDRRVGGPGVMPAQPAGLWEELSFLSGHTAQEFQQSQGGDAHRRSLYTYWKRSCPPPNMKVFDASERAVCTVRRSRTNTPLQALVLLNDPCFVEPVQELAVLAWRKYPDDTDAALALVFRQLVSRSPSVTEQQLLHELFQQSFEAHSKSSAGQLLPREVLQDLSSATLKAHELRTMAAIVTVAQVVFAMDETITIN